MSDTNTTIALDASSAEPSAPGSLLPALLKTGVRASHIEQYFGPWCVMPERFMSHVDMLQGSNVLEHIAARRAHQTVSPNADSEYEMIGNCMALLHATGPLTKYGTSYGDETSTVALRRQIRLCADDDVVQGVLLRIESPGGTCAGTQELADDIAALAAKKPVYAWCEDLCCSAAYWIAARCSKIFCNSTSIVGCIGTYAVVQDSSGMAEKLGIKVHVVKAGEFKGTATPGTEITEPQLTEYQRLVDTLNEFFLADVAAGRKLPPKQVSRLADGRVHVGQEAVQLGLADGVKTFDETIDALYAECTSQSADGAKQTAPPSTPKGTVTMSVSTQTSSTSVSAAPAATLNELKAALPGAKASFLVKCLEAGWTVAKAQQELLAKQAAEIAALKAAKAKDEDDEEDEDDLEDASEMEEEDDDEPRDTGKGKNKGKNKTRASGDGDDEPAKPAKSGKPKARRAPGVDPLAASSRRNSGDAMSEFNAAVREFMAMGKSRREAVAAVARTNPALHEEILRSDPRNRGSVQQKLIGQRFDEAVMLGSH